MHISNALLLLSVLVSAAPVALDSQIPGESILLLTCKGRDIPETPPYNGGHPWPGDSPFPPPGWPCIMGTCTAPPIWIPPIVVPCSLGGPCPGTQKRQSAKVAKYNSMAGYFPEGVTLSVKGTQGRNTQPKALETVADPSIEWTATHKSLELAGKEFSYTIKDSGGSATLDSSKFTCTKDQERQWNAWDQYGTWQFGCIVDYACTRA